MPENSDDLIEESNQSSPGNGEGITEELAGDLIGFPFEVWHILNEAALPLSDKEKRIVSGPVTRIIEKYELQKFAKDEILLTVYLAGMVYGRVRAIKEIKKNASNDSGETRKGKNDISENPDKSI